MDFEGLTRVLTILSRGFLFHEPDGSLATEPRGRIEYAHRGLCAWCSVPDKEKATPKAAWQFKTDFRDLHGEFPLLVDEEGSGWFHRHVHGVKVILMVSLFTLIVDVKGDYFLAARDLMMPITVLLPTRIMSSKGR